ncbi:MHYT domain-containing protein [Pseudofrankia sp. BMG5.37]|uniref:MHYT domain-containing protein n=1 Tax=Pseudofrankia sp. BMG5.37 TaxID=3050035 RepID=UPI002893E8D9|nr:MHYT domain-containing protein [Pseudofrankia sp. BMG5.37]MDT3438939.1 MHYT domain-containing protein [Pseudofrankia sp. BMG5.37]
MITAQAAQEHASSDTIFVASSIGLALIGSFAALVSALRIPSSQGAARRRWVAASAVSLGGGAIWSMHFMGMLGYHVGNRQLAYNLPLTALSLLIAVGVSAIGLSIVGSNPRSAGRLVVGGVIAGLGVAAMHYTGMAAMQSGSTVTYDTKLAGASVAIAVVAALAALWLAFRVRTTAHIVAASVVMAVAVCGMHYTAMAATQIAQTDHLDQISGADPIVLSFPVMLIAFTVLALIIFAALGGFANSGMSPLGVTGTNGRRSPAPAPAGRRSSAPTGRHQPAPAADTRDAAGRGAFDGQPGRERFDHAAPAGQDWAGYLPSQPAPAAPAFPEDDRQTPLYR